MMMSAIPVQRIALRVQFAQASVWVCRAQRSVAVMPRAFHSSPTAGDIRPIDLSSSRLRESHNTPPVARRYLSAANSATTAASACGKPTLLQLKITGILTPVRVSITRSSRGTFLQRCRARPYRPGHPPPSCPQGKCCQGLYRTRAAQVLVWPSRAACSQSQQGRGCLQPTRRRRRRGAEGRPFRPRSRCQVVTQDARVTKIRSSVPLLVVDSRLKNIPS
jgi:hypothetical protein